MSVSRSQILDLLQQQAMPQGVMFGGKRGPGRPRKVGRPRKTRGSGEMDIMEQVYGSARKRPKRRGGALMGGALMGGALIGGKKRMSQATKDMLALYKQKKKRTRGGARPNLSGLYDELIDEALYNGASMLEAEEMANDYLAKNDATLKYGIEKTTTKDGLIRAIKSLEKKLNLPNSITSELHKMPKSRLEKLLKLLQGEQGKSILGPITRAERYEYEDEEINPYTYGRLKPEVYEL
jgi:hypothetical protein